MAYETLNDYIYNVGDRLEHQGLSDDEIDQYFLEHYGTKGMKWGERKQRRFEKNTARVQKKTLDPMRRVAAGGGSKMDKFNVAAGVPLYRLAQKGGLAKGAAKNLERGEAFQAKVKIGKAKTNAMLLRWQGVDINKLNYKV